MTSLANLDCEVILVRTQDIVNKINSNQQLNEDESRFIAMM